MYLQHSELTVIVIVQSRKILNQSLQCKKLNWLRLYDKSIKFENLGFQLLRCFLKNNAIYYYY